MSRRYAAVAILCLCSFAGTLSAQSGKIDFGRDVLPILRENCVVCHGPAVQQSNFRLDRRSIAFRGGSRSVLIPGSSESSRLYLRISGQKQFGNLMPPTGALSPDKIATIKAWIDQGAVWPDEYANEEDLPAPDAKAVLLIDAMKAGDNATVQKLIGADPKVLNARGPDGMTPFMASILYSDAAMVVQFLQKGGDPNAKNDANATALMWAATNLDKTRLLLAHGANANARSKDGRTAMAIAAMQPGSTPVVKLLLDHGVKADSSPLRDAVVSGDVELMQFMMDHGVTTGASIAAARESNCEKCIEAIGKTVDARAATDALATLSVGAHPEDVKYALDHGANPNTADGQGVTPLMNIANSDRMPVESVRMMIEHGADVNAKNQYGQTVLDMAKLHGDSSPIIDLLEKAGAKTAAPPARPVTPLKSNTIDAAVQRSLPIIQKADITFMTKSGCISCHNEGLTQMTIGAARQTGYKVDEAIAAKQVENVHDFFDMWRDRLLQGVAPGGVAYSLVSLHAMGYKPDAITDAIARDIRLHQLANGSWRPGCGGSRPPVCGYEISNTALSMRSLQFYGLKTDRADYDKAVKAAAAWLVNAKPENTEDRAFRLMGLAWAGKDKNLIQQAIKDVVAGQKADGGWSDVPTLASAAYATGQSLVALHEGGMPVNDPVYQRGVKFLLATQLEDGSWYQKTRSLPVQPYFDAGFPHGYDQWVSVAGTSWATMALMYASPNSRPTTAAASGHH